MDEKKRVRRESSISVQARVSILDLAKMDRYWMEKEGEYMRSMSGLVGRTISAVVDGLEMSGEIPKGTDTVEDAHKYLTARGLYQRSLKKKSQSRIVAALGFEDMRRKGRDPREHHSRAFNTIHSKHAVQEDEEELTLYKSKCAISSDWDEIQRKIREAKEQEERENIEREVANAKSMGIVVDNPTECNSLLPNPDTAEVNEADEVKPDYSKMSEEEFIAVRQEKERKIRELENAEVDPSQIPTVGSKFERTEG